MKNNPDYFPRLNFTFLQVLAKLWVEKLPMIDKITFHHYLSSDKYDYVVICELSQFDPTEYGYQDEGDFYGEFVFHKFFKGDSIKDVYKSNYDKKNPEVEDRWFFWPKPLTEELPKCALKDSSWQLYPEEVEEKPDQKVKPEADNYFIREGKGWRIRFQGEKTAFPNHNYLRIIAHLLSSPGEAIKASFFSDSFNDNTQLLEDRLDQEGLSVNRPYRDCGGVGEKKIESIKKLEIELERETDPLVKRELEVDLGNAIADYKRYYNTGTKKKKLDDPHQKKAQAAVRKALNNANAAFIKAKMNKLAKHLKENINPDGGYDFVYRDTETPWDVKL